MSRSRSEEPRGLRLEAGGGVAWKRFFDQFSHVVLVGNSHEADVEELRARLPETALFVFFNRVYKILSEPFPGHSILVSCSTDKGALIVQAGVVDLVMPLLRPGRFHGVVDMLVEPGSIRNAPADFGEDDLFVLDLGGREADFYTKGQVPTTGLYFTLWLLDLGIVPPVHLYCFTGAPSPNWRMSKAHDWSFEQGVLRYLAARGRIVIEEPNPYAGDAIARVMRRFGESDPGMVAAAFADRHEKDIAALREAAFMRKPLPVRIRAAALKLLRIVAGKRRSEAMVVAKKPSGQG